MVLLHLRAGLYPSKRRKRDQGCRLQLKLLLVLEILLKFQTFEIIFIIFDRGFDLPSFCWTDNWSHILNRTETENPGFASRFCSVCFVG